MAWKTASEDVKARSPEDAPAKATDRAHSTSPRRHSSAPVSFLDDTWSWSSPSTWPLSVRFLPFPIACVVLFLGVYIQHFLSREPADPTDCSKSFDYHIPTQKIEKLAVDLATHDWEQGTAAEALLELHNPELAIFGSDPLPRGRIPMTKTDDIAALRFVLPKVPLGQLTLSNNTWGVADPASLGVFVLLAAVDIASNSSGARRYNEAAELQYRFLTSDAPRYYQGAAPTADGGGAISHRVEVAELCSDAMFMFPPFLAYYAVHESRDSSPLRTMQEAVEQISLYRDVLLIPSGPAQGAWRHIVGPSEMADPGAWSTGNGWAAYGILRVRATLSACSPGVHLLRSQIASLDEWTAEILDAAMRTDDHESGLLRNYWGGEEWFGEAAGTALLAAAAYRFAGMIDAGAEEGRLKRGRYAAWAERKREAVWARVNAEGVAAPAVNSLKHAQREPMDGVNPEAESFLLLLAAAWRDCVCSGKCGEV